MLHVTLNTGIAVEIEWSDDTPGTADLFDDLIESVGGAVPGHPPWRIDIRLGEGCAMFSIRRSASELAVLSALAWSSASAGEAWYEIEQPYLDTSDVLARLGNLHPGSDAMPEMPETIPWLASWVMPAAPAFATLDDAHWLADCEQAVAFAILRRHRCL
jgi:hypothetical protein